jgi:uncharacterized protein (DUF885 family)
MQLIKRGPVLGLWVLGLALGAGADAASAQRATDARGASAADRKLQALYNAEWQWRNLQYPDYEDTHKPVEDHLPKVDPASQLERLRYWQGVLQQLQAIHRSELSAAERLNYDIYKPQIETLISSQQFREYEMPANSDTTFWTELGASARRPYRTVKDYHNFIAQMRDIPRYFHEQMDEMRAGMRRGFTPPRVTLNGRDGSITAVSDVTPEDSLYYTPFKEMQGIAAAEQQGLRSEAVAVIRDTVQPAYRELLKFMREEYLPATRTTLAAQDLPDGKAYYRAKIREFVTLDRDPASIHEFGVAEVARLHQQMLDVMKETGFSGDFPAFLRFLRTDARFQPTSAEDLLMHAAYIAKRFDGKAPQYFGMLPRQRFAIVPVPDDLAPFYTAGRGGPGQYLLNTYDLPSRPMYNLTALTLHESAPGHCFQIPLAAEHKDQPEFRQHTYISAYGEGWALYSELLGVEMGMYATPYDRFGMLNYQIWRAVRLVVDTGVHAQGWTREQAVDYMREYTALAEHEINTEVDRYIAWPAQALSYYLGEDTILKARARAERALGARFNIRAFHDTVLELGSVPLPVLDERVDRFIAAGGVGPYPDME